MSYVIDVYSGRVQVQKNILKFALYVSFFPQLIAGPIVKYSGVARQIDMRKESAPLFLSGQRRFICGLAKKVLLANTFALTADAVWAMEPELMGSLTAWLGALSYTMQIYYDFSGYSDMAIGLGRMFGFRFKENFNYPYTSLSVQEFWRRWHISLSSWFKEYVYFPLGGSREGSGKPTEMYSSCFCLREYGTELISRSLRGDCCMRCYRLSRGFSRKAARQKSG